MKRLILLILMVSGCYAFVAAQDTCAFYLYAETKAQKEIVLRSASGLFDMNLMIGLKWLKADNKLQVQFDRFSVAGIDDHILLLPMYRKFEPIKNVINCKSGMKPLWSKLKSEDSKFVQYFVQSDNLKIDDFQECYRMLANNNDEEFIFELKGMEDFTITLPGYLVITAEKRPWYALSKRDKKVIYKTKPFDLKIQLDRKRAIDTCAFAEQVVKSIEMYRRILAEDAQELVEAQKNRSCIFFNLLKSKIYRTFVDVNDKNERYAKCETVAAVLKEYKNDFEKIYRLECVAPTTPPKTANCTLSENELSLINNRLKNLQMKINVKKKNNESLDDESKEYKALKAGILPRITPECRRSFKQAIEALENYCVIIESLL